MGAIFTCLKNTFQRHFGKLYPRISHIFAEYSPYSGTIKLQLSLNEHHIQAQQSCHLPLLTSCYSAATVYTIAIHIPQFCNAHFTILHHTFYNSATHKPPSIGGRFIVLASPPLMFRGWIFISSASINFTFVGVYIYADTANLPIQLLTDCYSDANKQPLHC